MSGLVLKELRGSSLINNDTPSHQERPTRALARKHGAQFAKFGTIGVVNTGVDLVIYTLLVAAGIFAAGANVASFLTANVASYLMNARFTFRQEGRAQPLSPGNYLKFFLAHAMSLVISTLVIFLLAGVIGALPAKLASIPITVVWNYLASALVVFKGAKENKSGTGDESL